MFAEWLPWLLFGLLAGALLDRWDRLREMWMVDAGRLLVVGGLAAAVLAGWASIPLLMLTGFLLGTGQTLVDTGSQALIPALVSRDPGRLERANGRLYSTQMVTQQLAGPPTGGFLFSVTSWIRCAADAVSFGVSSMLVAAIPARRTARGTGEASPPGRRTSLRIEIAEGLRWLFAQERLGLGSVGFGLLFTGSAVGGAVGGVVAPWLSRRLGSVPVMTGGSSSPGLLPSASG